MLLQNKQAKADSTRGAVDETLPLIIRLLDAERDLDTLSLDSLREAQAKNNTTLEESLIQANAITDRQIAAAYANHYLLPLYDPAEDELSVDAALVELLPAKLCRDHLIAPIASGDGTLDVAFFSPDVLFLVDELKLLTGREIRPLFAPLSVIERALDVLFESGAWTPSIAAGGAGFEEVDDSRDDEDDAVAAEVVVHLDQPPPPGRDGRIIRYVNQIFEQALNRGASDIHIEPFEDSCRVRLRVDGGLSEIAPPPLSMLTPIVSRIKVLAKMDIAEKRLPQDGSIGLRAGARRIDMRVNTCPTVHGEKVVLRILDRDAVPLQLTDLGMDKRQADDLSAAIQNPHGLMLVTGPTGSGKSTTLYSCLNFLNTPNSNIVTVEDPVEYKFAGINQVQTHNQVGLTFASALRSFLRQDPDVLMVGEVRDSETADICLRAALTGHFVLSTLHTNDALSAVSRLEDMGIEPFLLASTLRVVVAQRLLRRLCKDCCRPDQLDAETARRAGIPPQTTICRPHGCKECRETGYKGRIGVFEVIRITRSLAGQIQRRAALSELRESAIAEGMKLLAHGAVEAVCSGLTSLEEALSIAMSEEGR